LSVLLQIHLFDKGSFINFKIVHQVDIKILILPISAYLGCTIQFC
jgi:hypothetical protein